MDGRDAARCADLSAIAEPLRHMWSTLFYRTLVGLDDIIFTCTRW